MDENTKHLVAAQLTTAYCQKHSPFFDDERVIELTQVLQKLSGTEAESQSFAALFLVYKRFLLLLEQSDSTPDKPVNTDDAAD